MMKKKPMLSAVQKPKLYYSKPKMAGMKKPKMAGMKKPKLNEGFDSLPSKVQAKILKNKKPKMAAVKKPMDAERRAARKLRKADKKFEKAEKLLKRSDKQSGKAAGATRTSAIRKAKAGLKKINKAGGTFVKEKNKVKKLQAKKENLVGSAKRIAKRTKHLNKRIARQKK